MSKVYLFFGEEKYDIEREVEKIKKNFSNLENGINFFFITEENLGEISNISQGVSFFGEEKLVIIKDTKLKFDISIIKESIDNEITYIIIEDSVDKRLSSYKELIKIAEVREFKYMDSKMAIKYIVELLKKYSITIDYDTAEYMYEICGDGKENLINELKKIVYYIDDDNKKVDKQIIDKVCSKTLNAKLFDMLDLIVEKNYKKGIEMLDELLLQKEAIVKIYIMLYRQIKQMYMIKILKSSGGKDIAKELEIHPFVFQKLSKSSDKYKLDDLKKIIKMFDEYDEKTKVGDMDFEIGLKKIICAM